MLGYIALRVQTTLSPQEEAAQISYLSSSSTSSWSYSSILSSDLSNSIHQLFFFSLIFMTAFLGKKKQNIFK